VYLTEAFLQDAYGATNVAALCPTAGELAITITLAEAEVASALEQGGYSTAIPASVYASIDDVPDQIKLAAYGAWLELAHLRQREPLPNEARAYANRIEQLRKGELTVPGAPRETVRAPGGATATDASSISNESSGARPAIFDRSTLEGF
jgi:hypothetical protein